MKISRALLFKAMILVFCLVAVQAQQAPINCKGPLSQEQLIGLLKAKVDDVRVQAIVKQCGVGFSLTTDTERIIRAAGASNAVVAAVHAGAPIVEAPSTMPTITHVKPASATTRIKAPAGDFTLWIDSSIWKQDKTDGNKLTFTRAKGDAFGMLLAEQISIPIEILKNIVLQNLRSAGSNVEVLSEDRRNVNGREILHMQLSATIQQIPFIYHAYIYGGSSGTLQVMAGTIKGTRSVTDSDLIQFLDGVEITDTPLPPAPEGSAPADTNLTGPLVLNSGKFLIAYDPKKWRKQSEDKGRVTLAHVNGGGFAFVIPEESELPFDVIASIAQSMARQADPNAKVISQEKRVVSGHEVWCMTFEAAPMKIPFKYYGYYYSGKAGTIQLVTYTTLPLFDSYEADFTELLNSLVIKE